MVPSEDGLLSEGCASIAKLNLNLLSQTIESERKPTSKDHMKQLLMSLLSLGDGAPPLPVALSRGSRRNAGTQVTAQGTDIRGCPVQLLVGYM